MCIRACKRLLVSRGVFSAVSGHLFRHGHEPGSPFRWAPLATPTLLQSIVPGCPGMPQDAPGPCQVWSAGGHLWATQKSRRASAQRSCRARDVEVATVLDVVLLGRVGWAGPVLVSVEFVSGAYCQNDEYIYIYIYTLYIYIHYIKYLIYIIQYTL